MPQEPELVVEDALELLGTEAPEVVNWVAHKFGALSPGRDLLDRTERDHPVPLRELHEHRSADATGSTDRAKPRCGKQSSANVDLIAPAAGGRQPLKSTQRLRRREQRERSWRASDRDHHRTARQCSSQRLPDHSQHHTRRRRLEIERQSVRHRHKRDGRRDPRISRSGHQRQPAAQRHPPDNNPLRVNALQPPSVIHSRPPILELPTQRNPAPRLAAAAAPVPVIGRDHDEAGAGKALRCAATVYRPPEAARRGRRVGLSRPILLPPARSFVGCPVRWDSVTRARVLLLGDSANAVSRDGRVVLHRCRLAPTDPRFAPARQNRQLFICSTSASTRPRRGRRPDGGSDEAKRDRSWPRRRTRQNQQRSSRR